MATETTHQAGHAAAAAGHGGAQEATGMPQLDITTFDNQIFWLVVALIVIYFVLSRVALPRIEGILAERAGTITGDIATAEELKRKAEQAEEAYQKALADARAKAQEIAAETKAKIKAELSEAMAEADRQIAERQASAEKSIAEMRESALATVGEIARDVAKEVVAALGFKADGRKISSAVTKRLKG